MRKNYFSHLFESAPLVRSAGYPHHASLQLESLEDRKMLAVTTYVNDNWVNLDGPTLELGDLVMSSLDPGTVTMAEYGFDAFGTVGGLSVPGGATIFDAVQNTSTGGTLNLLPGTFKESDIVIDRPMTFQGRLVSGNLASLIMPEVTSANTTADFAAGTHSGIIIYSPSVTIQNLKVDGSANAALGSNLEFHHGITTLYGVQGGPAYMSLRNGALQPIILGTPGGGENGFLNASVPAIDINNVDVTNTFWHGITISPLFNRNFDTGQNETYNLQVRNSSISNVGDVKDANRIGVLLSNLNDDKDGMGNATNLVISNVGVGIKTAPYGDNVGFTYGSSINASNQSFINFITVNDPVVTGFEVIDGSNPDARGWIVKFTNPVNNGTGILLNRSRASLQGANVTNAKIGVHVQNSPLAVANGNNDRHPMLTWDNHLTGPGSAVPGSVGVLVDSKPGDPHASNFIIREQNAITGYEIGVKVEQATPVGSGLKNTVLFSGGRIYGNAVDVSIGQNSVGSGKIENPVGLPATKLAVLSNGEWDPRMFNYDAQDPYYLVTPANYPVPIPAKPNAEIDRTGNVAFGPSATYAALLTGEMNSAPLFDFNSTATYAFSTPPSDPEDGVVPQPYGALFGWFGNVTQNDGTLTVSGSAVNGYGYDFLYGTKNTKITSGPNNGMYQLVGTNISDKTHLNVKIRLLPTNQSDTLAVGLLDMRGNVAMYTIDCTELSTVSYTTVSIPILSPSLPLTGPDFNLDITNIVGWVVGGDQGLANGRHNVPVGFKIDEITTSSVPNSELIVTGSVNLGGANLNLNLQPGYTPSVNQTFILVNNDGADPVVGTFQGFANGSSVEVGGNHWRVQYNAGDGNDVVLTFLGGETTVAGRHIFYNQSHWDGNSAAIDAADNLAIAPDKSAYLPGAGLAAYNNITSYSRGINGIMVDLSAGANHTAITADDFSFKVGNNNAPDTWAAAPAPSAVSVIPGGGVGGSDRVVITWSASLISNEWLEVQVLPTADTGLAAADVHFWGNKIADSGTATPAGTFATTSIDAAQAMAAIGSGKPITEPRDYNRDGQVNTSDAAIVFANVGTLARINIGAGGPFAPQSVPMTATAKSDPVTSDLADDSAVALALTISSRNREDAVLTAPGNTSTDAGSEERAAQPNRPLAQINQTDLAHASAFDHAESHDLNLEDELLDSLLDGVADRP